MKKKKLIILIVERESKFVLSLFSAYPRFCRAPVELSSLGTDVSAISDARITAEGTIFHFHERGGTMCSQKAAEVAKKGRGMEDVRNLAQKSITCDAGEAGK